MNKEKQFLVESLGTDRNAYERLRMGFAKIYGCTVFF